MSVAKNWKKLVSSLFGRTAPRRRARPSFSSMRVEALEDRTTPVILPPQWTPLPTAPGGLGVMMLMTDGTVLAENGSNNHGWMKLTPNATGSYTSGTWTTVASMSLNRLYFGSNVLPDGRMFVLGGEYTGAASGTSLTANWTNTGEIYNPLTNTWTGILNFPQSQFGDDPTVLLPNGKILAGYLSGPQTYLYDPATNTWAATGTKQVSNGFNDRSDEETFVLLPGGKVLTTEIFTGNPEHGQIYDSATGTWSIAGTIPVILSTGGRGELGTGAEMGPAGLLPDGRVIYIGADGTVGTNPLLGAPTALYTPSTNTWTAGPQIPVAGAGSDDAPGAVLPNGHFIFTADQARPGSSSTTYFQPPTHLYDFDPTLNTITDITATLPAALQTELAANPAFVGRMLVLPTGQVMFTPNGDSSGWVYTPDGVPQDPWRPTINTITRTGAGTYTITGTQLTGLSAGASYGDDAEMDSNYPIVQLTNGSGNVFYARSHDWTPGVATGAAVVTSKFDLPAGLANGSYQLRVIANGIASAPTTIIVGDTTGPVTSGVSVSPNPANTTPTTAFTISDSTTGNSPVMAAEFFVDNPSGTSGTGTAISATFGTVTVTGSFTVPGFAGLSEGTHTVSVHGLDAAGNWGTFATAAFVKDTLAPTVSNVTSPNADATYGVGQVISIQVTFSEAVTVIGSASLALNSGGSAILTGGSGTNTLTFTYTVAAGESSPDLDYGSNIALLLGGGGSSIKDAAGNNANLILPAPAATGSLGFNKNIVISTTVVDATGPVTSGVSVSPNPANAPPVTAFTISDAATGGSNVTAAEYFLDGTGANGSGTVISAAFGTVTVTGAFTVAGFAALSEGTHQVFVHGKDAAGNWGSAVSAAFVKDTVAPAVTNVTSTTTANGTYGAGTVILIQVTFTEVVTVTGTPTLALNAGGGASASYTGGTGTSILTFTYTVAAGQSTPDLNYTSTSALAGGTIKDAVGNAATLTLPGTASTGSLGVNKDIVIDAVAPVVQHYYVLFGTSGKYDLVGSTRNDLPWEITGIQVVFSKAIAAGDVNSLTGLTTTGFAGLGTNTLTWTFGPINLGVFSTALLGAGTSALKDAAGNALSAGSGYLQAFKVLQGDVNDDGVVASNDMVLASRISAGIDAYSLFADMDGNGSVGSDDVLKIRRRIGTHL